MVHAFIIHTLFPGQCKVLFYQTFVSTEPNSQCASEGSKECKRKEQIDYAAAQVHSEYQFRRSVMNRTVEDDTLALNQDDQLPEFEIGFLRLREGFPFHEDKVSVWLGVGNTGFTLICEKEENRILAESVLKLLIRYLQQYLRVLNQPAEAALKADRVCLIISKVLPDGALIFMNSRLIRIIEKELEIMMKGY